MIEEQILTTIDEIQGMLARALVQGLMEKSTSIIEAEAKGKALATKLGKMIENDCSD